MCVCVCVCCAFVGPHNILYNKHGTCIKIAPHSLQFPIREKTHGASLNPTLFYICW